MLGGGLSLDLVYHPTFVALEVISNLLLGDANNDNQVTGADLVEMRSTADLWSARQGFTSVLLDLRVRYIWIQSTCKMAR